MKILFLMAAILILNGCSSMGVEPRDRDLLAQKSMTPGADYFDNFYDDHIYFSKEASSGGTGIGGGGCGCN